MLRVHVHFSWLILFLVGCQSPATKPPNPAPTWPPGKPRIHYMGQATNARELGAKTSLWDKTVNMLTGSRRGKELWQRPTGICVDENGVLGLTDTGTGRVMLYDPFSRKFTSWHSINKQPFQLPVAIALHGNCVFVADSARGEVIAFNRRGRHVFTIADPLLRPTGLALLGDRLIVSDALHHQLFSFNLEGILLDTVGARGSTAGTFNFPTHLASNGHDRLYVNDAMNFRIQVLDENLKAITHFGKVGQASGQFSRPKGVATDTDGHIYVADALFDNVQIFDTNGRFLMHWGEAGQKVGKFWMPAGIAIDRQNCIYVADTYNQRIQMFKYREPTGP